MKINNHHTGVGRFGARVAGRGSAAQRPRALQRTRPHLGAVYPPLPALPRQVRVLCE